MKLDSLSARVKARGLPGGVKQVADAVGRSTVTIHGWDNSGDPLAEASIAYALSLERSKRACAAATEAQRLLPDEQVTASILGDTVLLVAFRADTPDGIARTQPVDITDPVRVGRWFASIVNTERKRHA